MIRVKLHCVAVLGLAFAGWTELANASLTVAKSFVICRAPGTQDQVALASNASGLTAVVWRDGRNDPGNPTDIYGQALAADGSFLWAPGDTGIAICRASGIQEDPDVSVGADGGIWVAWADHRVQWQIYVQGLSSAGALSCPTDGAPAITAGGAGAFHPKILSVGLGTAVTAFSYAHYHNVGAYDDWVSAQKLGSACARAWGTEGNCVYCQFWPNDQPDLHPTMTDDGGAGGAILAWVDPILGAKLWVRRVDSSGTGLWGSPVRASAVSGQDAPALAPDGSGGVIAVWSQGASPSRTIVGQRIDGSGVRQWGDTGKVIAGGPGDCASPQIVRSDSGRSFVTWQQGSSGNENLYAQTITFLGDTLRTRIPIGTAPYSQTRARAVADGAGNAYVVWEDERNLAIGDTGDIYLQKIDRGGTTGGTSNIPVSALAGAPAGTRQSEPRIASDGHGGVFVVWSDNRNGNPDLYGALLNPVVAVVVEDLSAVPTETGVRLTWRLTDQVLRGLSGAHVQRADGPAGPYATRTTSPLALEREMSFEDSGVEPGRTYWYRLVLQQADGAETLSSPIEVTVAGGRAWTTDLRVRPAPEDGGFELRYRIARPATPVCLAIYDVRGLRVELLSEGLRGVGEYVRRWNPALRAGGRLARGVYLVELRAGGARLSRKLVLVRE